MLTKYEAWKLQREMQTELDATDSALIVCVVLVLLIFALAWFSASDKGPRAYSSVTPVQPVAFGIARSKDVFDERRIRYIEAYPDSRVALSYSNQRFLDAAAEGDHLYYSRR